jgi:hypothetical protein
MTEGTVVYDETNFMGLVRKSMQTHVAQDQELSEGPNLAQFVPAAVYPLDNPQTKPRD